MTSQRVRELAESAVTEALSELDKLGQPHRVGCNLAAAFGFLKAEWEKESTLEAEAAAMREALSLIAYTSSIPGAGGTQLDHAERWLEKATTARKALESTTAGQGLLARIKALEEKNRTLVALLPTDAECSAFVHGAAWCDSEGFHNEAEAIRSYMARIGVRDNAEPGALPLVPWWSGQTATKGAGAGGI